MLSKIIKYELKSTARIFLLVFGALIVVALLGMLLMPSYSVESDDIAISSADTIRNIFFGLMSVIYVLAAIATAVVTTVIIIVRFYRMLGNEGYLWFTLPVTANKHILGKLIISFMWQVASVIVILLSALLFCSKLLIMEDVNIFVSISGFLALISGAGVNVGLFIFLIILSLLIASASSILMYYAAIAMGPHLTKNRLGGSVLAYIIIYVITQVVSTVIVQVSAINLASTVVDATAFGMGMDIASSIPGAEVLSVLNGTGVGMLVITMVINIIYGAVAYFLTHRFISKKLNLA